MLRGSMVDAPKKEVQDFGDVVSKKPFQVRFWMVVALALVVIIAIGGYFYTQHRQREALREAASAYLSIPYADLSEEQQWVVLEGITGAKRDVFLKSGVSGGYFSNTDDALKVASLLAILGKSDKARDVYAYIDKTADASVKTAGFYESYADVTKNDHDKYVSLIEKAKQAVSESSLSEGEKKILLYRYDLKTGKVKEE